jgi:hypothetical protein
MLGMVTNEPMRPAVDQQAHVPDMEKLVCAGHSQKGMGGHLREIHEAEKKIFKTENLRGVKV